jgi:hypothetical protein
MTATMISSATLTMKRRMPAKRVMTVNLSPHTSWPAAKAAT